MVIINGGLNKLFTSFCKSSNQRTNYLKDDLEIPVLDFTVVY